MQFQVPQFIDIEDKIFGPFTFKQFIYMVGGAGGSFVAYRLLPFYLAIFVIAAFIGLALALAFIRVNNRPFIQVLESYLRFTLGNKLFIWKRIPKKREKKALEREDTKDIDALVVPRISESKLKELAWSLDVHAKTNNRRAQNDTGRM